MQGQAFFELIGPLVFLAFAFGFLEIRRHMPQFASAGLLALSYLLRACGYGADYFRAEMPADFAIFAAIVPFLGAGVAFGAGILRLYRVPVPWAVYGICVAVILAAVSWFRFVDDSVVARVIVMNGAAAAALAYLAVAIRSGIRRRIDRFLQILFIVNAGQFVLRTAAMLWLEGHLLTEANYAGSLTGSSLRFSIVVATVAIVATLFAIYGMEIVATLTRNSHTDPLTGVLNRRGFDAAVSRLQARHRPGASGHGFVLADIDGFKSINDRFGHDVGDTVIARVARILQGAARENDIVARWGGEEFAILVADGGEGMARLYAESVRVVVEDLELECLQGASVTISFGVAGWRHGETLREVGKRADDALYDAKTSGRNRVCVATERSPQASGAVA
ncbi:GGDEF domain-containing protein [Oricola thermophila]|uniref:diguanylate cyclase n=1 Tax=Oricola thermophila TaxID=2742145 RepID=A0A6N1VGQ8_9HYPH|nr:GGDEF domain-containing protein [Oricola thermophila]QKV19968.1 GGDEF domain-containing protein [Oricola thermophila]